MVTPSTTTSFSLPLGPDSRWAVFIDLDDTLLDGCSKPERVVLNAALGMSLADRRARWESMKALRRHDVTRWRCDFVSAFGHMPRIAA
jgi:hypothetical protein